MDRLYETSPRICKGEPGDRDIHYGSGNNYGNNYDSSNSSGSFNNHDLIKDCSGNHGIVIDNNIYIHGEMEVREVAGREGLEDEIEGESEKEAGREMREVLRRTHHAGVSHEPRGSQVQIPAL